MNNDSILKGLSSEFAGTSKRARVFGVLEKYLESQRSGTIQDLRKTLIRYCFVSRDRATIWIDELMDMGIIDINGNMWVFCNGNSEDSKENRSKRKESIKKALERDKAEKEAIKNDKR